MISSFKSFLIDMFGITKIVTLPKLFVILYAMDLGICLATVFDVSMNT